MYLSSISPYNLSDVIQDSKNRLSFTSRTRLLWEDIEGVRAHVCAEGDTLISLAVRYFGASISGISGARLWWAIADFQPAPINDPTVTLKAGEIILIPPLPAIQAALVNDTVSPMGEL